MKNISTIYISVILVLFTYYYGIYLYFVLAFI